MKCIALVLSLAALAPTAHAEADGLRGSMTPVQIVMGMKSVVSDAGIQDLFEYRIDHVGTLLVPRWNGICDLLENRQSGTQEIKFTRADGSSLRVQVPRIEKSVVTGRCDELAARAHLSP